MTDSEQSTALGSDAFKMGAWGHNLFESDKDFDIISELDHEVGLAALEEQAIDAQVQDQKKQKKDDEIRYSMFAGLCNDVEKVRNFLDSGPLATLLAKYEAAMLFLEAKEMEFYREADYIFMLIGACAMTLGCTIPKKYRDTMQKVYMCVGLDKGAVKQLDAALNGPGNYMYKGGEPHSFDYPSRLEDEAFEAAETERKERGPGSFTMLNVNGPGTLFFNPPKGSTNGLKELKAKYAAGLLHGGNFCGSCGSDTGKDGSALSTCGKCKSCKYCGTECQKKHWKVHKKVCKAPM